MEQLKDEIYDAYYGDNENEFTKKVRERIHWITQSVKGTDILDIGCSQGITAILLGREGKKVFAIDSSSQAIEDAKENLLKEEKDVQGNIEFMKTNFFMNEFTDSYDSVIMGEVLEHLTDVTTFFNKAINLTKENGRIIVTTPFGINEFIDHKRTFYLLDLLKLQSENLYIEEIKFFGKWIGVIYKKEEGSKGIIQVSENLLKDLENNVKRIEEDYLKQLKNANSNKHDSSKEDLLNEKVEKVNLQKELVESYNNSEAIIKSYKKLSRDYEKLQQRYFNLRNSKLGKITSKYWEIRRKKRGK